MRTILSLAFLIILIFCGWSGYKKGLKVNIIDGDEKNYKITTEVDLQKFREQIERTAE